MKRTQAKTEFYQKVPHHAENEIDFDFFILEFEGRNPKSLLGFATVCSVNEAPKGFKLGHWVHMILGEHLNRFSLYQTMEYGPISLSNI